MTRDVNLEEIAEANREDIGTLRVSAETFAAMLKELKKMNLHLAFITDVIIEGEDLEE